MLLHIKNTSKLSGMLSPPSSKSQNIRGILFAALSSGKSNIINRLESDDTSDAIKLVTALDVNVQIINDHKMSLNSTGIPFQTKETAFFSGNSGLTTLFSLPLSGFRDKPDETITFDCSEQMRTRPVAPLVSALNSLGMNINYLKEKEKYPISVSGKLEGGNVTVDGFNSQYLSALLISLPLAPSDSIITVENLHERPYIEMTLSWLDRQGVEYRHELIENKDIFHIKGKQTYQPFDGYIPVDFSSASCLLAAAALVPGEVSLQGLDMNEPQSDKALIPILEKMGANLKFNQNTLCIQGNIPLTGIEIDANDFPDLIPALCTIATQAKGKTKIYNVAHARIKETDRIESMAEGLRKMGAKVETFEDGIVIEQSKLKGAKVKGFGDHRTVMALSVAGLVAEGETIVDDAEAINKTFPNFVEMMQSIGAKMTLG